MKRHIRRLAAVAAVAAMGLAVAQGVSGAEQAQAVCTAGIGRWLHNTYAPQIRSSVPSAWNPSVVAALKRWNGIPGSTLHYAAPHFNAPRDDGGNQFQVNFFSLRLNGYPDVPGLALGSDLPNHGNVMVGLNSDFSWNTSGIMSQASRRVDVQTILVHESGHASGLAHPYASICGPGHPTAAERDGVMNVTWTTKRVPTADDKSGIAARY